MKKIFYLSLLLSFTFFVSCSDDDTNTPYAPQIPEVAILNINNETSVAINDTIYLKANVSSRQRSKFVWSVSGNLKSASPSVTDSIFKFVQKEIGDYTVTLTCINPDGESSASIHLSVFGGFRNGTFILNEGSAFQENSSLSFINAKGVITDSVYWKVNGTELGNTTQDLFIGGGKIYFIAQNGKSSVGKYANDGKLIIANAETLKKEAAYDDELSTLSWPTHVAALGNEVFIRDNNGVHSFNTSTSELKLIEGSAGALKNRMVIANNKIFVPARNSVLVVEAGKAEISHKIEFDATVSGIVKAGDGNIYVSTTGTPNKITKIDATNYSIIKGNEITEGKLSAGYGASPAICAKGDTIYYGNATTKIYRHIFSTGESKYLIDPKVGDGIEIIEDAAMAYNNITIHPITGEVYQTTIKGYGVNYLINNISVFNFSRNEPQLVTNYKNHTHFPVGVFFTYDF